MAEKCFDVVYARKCLDESLMQLKTDYIDIYFLHEPNASILENEDEMRVFLDAAVSAGKIRCWGTAYKAPELFFTSSVLNGSVAQFEGNLSTYSKCNEIIANSKNRIVTRPFLGGYMQIPSLKVFFESNEISKKMKMLEVSTEDVALCLSARLAGGNGSVVCSMFSPDHIHRNYKVLAHLCQTSEMQSILDLLTKTRVLMDGALS